MRRSTPSGAAGSRRSVEIAGIVALGCALALPACAPRPERPRTILLIVVDTLRADRLGCYGSPRDLTPHLDELARESVRFAHAQAHSPWTLPSVGSILTSVVPTALWEPGSNGRLRGDLPTLPEILARDGYHTLASVNSRLFDPRFGLDRGFAPEDYDVFPSRNDFLRPAREAVEDLLLRLDELPGSEPLFLLLHLFDPHLDYRPPRAFLERIGGGDDPRGDRFEPGPEIQDDDWSPDAGTRRWIERLHDAEVAAVDDAIGTLLRELARRGRADDALVVFTADHGEEFFEHGGFEHGHTVYQELLHVPLLIRIPGGAHAGTVVDAPVRQIDIAPTVLDVAGIDPPEGFQGKPLLPPPPPGAPPSACVAEFLLYGSERKSVRVGRYKLVTDEWRRPFALYDLREDPAERKDVLATQPDRARDLARELVRFVGDESRAPTPRFSFSGDATLREILAELGYIERN